MGYSSKIDLWLVLLLATTNLFFLYSMYEVWALQGISLSLILLILLFGTVSYLLWLPVFNTRYTCTEHALEVNCMFFHWQIPYQNIQSVKPCYSLISAPALSVQRVEVVYIVHGLHESIMLSPRQQHKFCQLLQEKIGMSQA